MTYDDDARRVHNEEVEKIFDAIKSISKDSEEGKFLEILMSVFYELGYVGGVLDSHADSETRDTAYLAHAVRLNIFQEEFQKLLEEVRNE